MRRLALSIVTLLAFAMLVLAAQSHGRDMALAGTGQMSAAQAHGDHAAAMGKMHCAEPTDCQAMPELCDFVCSGMVNFILAAASGQAPLVLMFRLVPNPPEDHGDGIHPGRDDRPPILMFA